MLGAGIVTNDNLQSASEDFFDGRSRDYALDASAQNVTNSSERSAPADGSGTAGGLPTIDNSKCYEFKHSDFTGPVGFGSPTYFIWRRDNTADTLCL